MINKDYLKIEAEKIGVSLDDTAIARFDDFAEMLVETNKHLNLTAIVEPDEIVLKHFVDSISLLAKYDIENGAKIIDVGCGAGFPSIPLLIARPDLNITFLDSTRKRLTFIEDALKNLELEGTILHSRAEDAGQSKEYRESFDYSVSRAVAPLNILAEYSLPLVKIGGCFIAMKGAEDESPLAKEAIKTLGGEIESVVSFKLSNGDARNIIITKKISQTPTKYPRKSKKIDTMPL